jgi:hypothetical protein
MTRREAEAIRDEHGASAQWCVGLHRAPVSFPCPTRRLAEAYLVALDALKVWLPHVEPEEDRPDADER